ncbi:peroxiredoxin, type II [Volvox carteri f. nagariensis]|uniref:Glutaredoxin-dependent peroxiredoxin n=1 Tax=Volvox carteri f. nagariensis TaxID=3068 RepID=D8UCL3_VOLCA|nr:peroxiredoxin, type II [Volvox carteri f. nagariensis]EFJ42511.1 peroxiredoxin, type II [Volvox carteri f. nagariensis]|eukprot:XP_002956367.1 peroxiredoxin, type II [Volvox carteri f. nagariensis]
MLANICRQQSRLAVKRARQAAIRFCTASPGRAMIAPQAIAVGQKLPDAKFKYFDGEGQMRDVTTEELCKGKKVVLFAVPGAFTPTCSLKHVPGFVDKADELKNKGVDTIACVSVNDAFVMAAWGKDLKAGDKVLMLADGNGQFTKALGVELDLIDKGLGTRSRRYSMFVDDQVVKILHLEEGGAFTVSSAEDMLAALP